MLRRQPKVDVHPADHPHPMERFFDGLRRMRRERSAGREPRPEKRRAIITIVHNEAEFLPIWLRYYSRFFAAEDTYVLDNDTTDGSTDGDGFVRLPVPTPNLDNIWMRDRVQELQHELLERYEVVLFADADEIVIPAPGRGTLGEYIDQLEEEFVNPFGFELIHLPDREPPFDPARPVLEQRRFWFPNDAYNKPALTTTPMQWKVGFHERVDERKNLDPDLRMIHLHRVDYELCRARHAMRRERGRAPRDVKEGWGAQYSATRGRRRFDRWFFGRSGMDDYGIEMEIQEIPASWRGLF